MSVRLKDVADRAGVSVRTVSNVVSGAAPVAPDTRRRVQRSLDELGYRPNLAARSLRAGRTGIIGLAIPELHSPYFAELAGLLVDEAQRRSWTVIIDQTLGAPDVERRLLEGGSGRVVDGLIISPWALDPAVLTDLAAGDPAVPLVLLGERSPHGAADHVAVDNVAAASDATNLLLGRGCRRVAAIGLQPHLHNGTAQLRAKGYREALDRADLPNIEEMQRPVAALHRADGARAMVELLNMPSPPDGVFAFSDELAIGALYAAHQRGLRVPDDIAIVGFDDIEDGSYCYPALTTIAPDKQQIAMRSLQCLADRIYSPGNAVAAQGITVAHRLVVRDTA